MITKHDLLERRGNYERQEQQSLADANAAHGAIMAIDDLIAQLDSEEKAVINDGTSSHAD